MTKPGSKNAIVWIIAANIFIRLLFALFTNLGNDEVYYTLYALYPNICHFDHPALVGLLIRLSTFNLHFLYNDFFVRLGPLLIGSINIFLIYKLGITIKDRLTGIFAALLYSSSFYGSVLVGVFILPDTPLSVFWLLAIFAFTKYIKSTDQSMKWLLLFGVVVGLGMHAKYQAIFLWFGAGLFILLYEWKTLLSLKFWIPAFVSLLIFSPALWWNFSSEFSGINYHSGRVGSDSWMPTLKYIGPEFFGQIFYNNPINVFLIILALRQLLKNGIKKINRETVFLLSVSIPLILLVLGMSLYNRTLPHWSGPSYFALILITAAYLSNAAETAKKKIKKLVFAANSFFILMGIVAILQVTTGVLPLANSDKPERLGKNDFTVDLGMWNDIAKEIAAKTERDKIQDEPFTAQAIITHKWFPAAHIDYYYALKNNIPLYIWGKSNKKHEYLRINKLRGEIQVHANAYYITTSNHYQAPEPATTQKFESIEGPEIIPVKKGKYEKVNVFIWQLKNLQEKGE